MRVLVACEYSGVVRRAFAAKGHEAWSCDLLPADDGSLKHLQGDAVLAAYVYDWDMMIAHPPCTYLSNSGVCHLMKGVPKGSINWVDHLDGSALERWHNMVEGAEFFDKLFNVNIPKICIENPVMHGYAKQVIGVKQSQTIQPYQFGHTEQKRTCLWLKGLRPLVEEDNVYEEMMLLPKRERQRLHYLPPSPDRWKLRSTTYDGIAKAMANQWG